MYCRRGSSFWRNLFANAFHDATLPLQYTYIQPSYLLSDRLCKLVTFNFYYSVDPNTKSCVSTGSEDVKNSENKPLYTFLTSEGDINGIQLPAGQYVLKCIN